MAVAREEKNVTVCSDSKSRNALNSGSVVRKMPYDTPLDSRG